MKILFVLLFLVSCANLENSKIASPDEDKFSEPAAGSCFK